MRGRQNGNNDMAFYVFTIAMGAMLLAVIYAYARKFLNGRRAVLPAQVIIRNQQKSEAKARKQAQLMESQPKAELALPPAPAAVTRETSSVVFSSPESPKINKKKPKIIKSETKADKTSAVQAKLFARKQEKQQQQELERQKVAASNKERASATARFKERRAEMRLQKEEELRQMAKMLANSPVEDAAVVMPAFYPSITVEAKNQLKVHALFLAEFAYDNKAELRAASQHPVTQTLAFLYHFHRYNICRRLLKDKDEDVSGTVELRTLLVHLANKIDLKPEMILDTKAQLCSFMGEEVTRRVQKGRYISAKDDTALQHLIAVIGDGVNKLHFNSIQSLPLYAELYGLRGELNDHPLAPDQITALDLYKWIREKIIPYMNALCVERPENWQDTLKMLVVILGEYCDTSHRAAMKKIFAGIGDESRTALANVRAFMHECRTLRNHLAHNIFDVNLDDLLALQDFACTNISSRVADVTMMEDILVPQVAAVPAAAPQRIKMSSVV